MKRGMNGGDIKRTNRGLFLKNIALGKANSRIELAKLTGLTKMTAGNITQELISMGIIKECGQIYAGVTGPAPQKLCIDENAPKIIGVYISRDEIVFSLGNLSGDIIHKNIVPLSNETSESITEKLVSGIKKAITTQTDNILAIGVAMIGPIDSDGAIVDSPNFFGIKKLAVKEIIESNFPYPTVICNDISAAAVAEHLKGGERLSNFIFVGISNGLGAGIIQNGELMTSNDSFLGEFGHITININGEKCPCGNTGCLELYASHTVLLKRLGDAVNQNISAKDFDTLTENPECDKIFTDIAEKLAAGMITVTNLLRPEAFILGYDGYFLPDKYVNIIEEKINSLRFLKQDKRIKVCKAVLKSNSAIFGSIAIVLREVFKGEILFN